MVGGVNTVFGYGVFAAIYFVTRDHRVAIVVATMEPGAETADRLDHIKSVAVARHGAVSVERGGGFEVQPLAVAVEDESDPGKRDEDDLSLKTNNLFKIKKDTV